MKNEVLYDSNLHFEHNQWNKELDFWEDEIKSFKNRLEEIAERWTDKNVLTQLDHFQNQFLIHSEIINDLQEEIQAHEMNIAAYDERGEKAMDRILTLNHIDFRDKMETQRKIYAELKQKFYKFLTKYM